MQQVIEETEHRCRQAGGRERSDRGLDQPGAKTRHAHQHGGRTRQRDNKVDGDHVGKAGDDAAHELALVFQTDEADDDAHQQEPDRGVIEPPPAERVAGEEAGPAECAEDACGQFFPGDEAQDHDDEGQAEDDQNDLLAAGELDILIDLGRAAVGCAAGLELVSREDRALLVLHGLGIAGDKKRGNEVGHEPQDDAEHIDRAHVDVHTRGRHGSAGGKGVDGGAQNAAAGAQKNGRRTDQRVKARGHHGRRQQDVEADSFFAHAIGGAADGEHEHQDPDERHLLAVQLLHQHMDTGLQRARGRHDGQEGTQAEYEADDIAGVMPAVDRRHENVAQACADDFRRLTGLGIGVGAALRNPGGDGHQQQHTKQNRKCAYRTSLVLFHGFFLLFILAGRPFTSSEPCRSCPQGPRPHGTET